MAEKNESNYEKLNKKMSHAKEYLQRVKDENYKAIIKANEAIDYKFTDMDEKTKDMYITKLSDEMKKNLKKRFSMDKVDESTLDSMIDFFGGITYDEIREIVEQHGKNFTPDKLSYHLKRKEDQFDKRHYLSVAKHYIKKDKHKKDAIKYLEKEDLIKPDNLSVEKMHELLIEKAHTGDVKYESIPSEARKEKKKAA